jgi:hypothetical protein
VTELHVLNFFQFLPLNRENAERCPNGNAPGILLIVDRGEPLSWAYVGTATDTLQSRVASLLDDPGPLKEVIERGATFATCIVRSSDTRAAAEAFLVQRLTPALHAPLRSPRGDYEFKLKLHCPPEDVPPNR